MTELSDGVLAHLRAVTDELDLGSARYRILGEIGRGGMGAVYLAEDRELERTVAIKVIHAHDTERATAERLKSEARILARLEHPGIVPVYDAGAAADGRPYYVMKYVAGRRLDELARDGASLRERLAVFRRVCEAVAAAHAQGVIHRDLKPENVRVGPFGEVLVLDFGLAKVLRDVGARDVTSGATRDATTDEASGSISGMTTGLAETHERGLSPAETRARAPRATSQGTVAGTPGYMAPEQARGDVDAIDERSDVFALGAILAFLLEDDAPRALSAIAAKAMQPERADRYPTAGALALDLENYDSRLPVSAHRESIGARIARVAVRYQTPILLVAAYLVLRLVLLFFRSG